MTLQIAKDWGCKPWEITSESRESVTPWQLYVWKQRRNLLVSLQNEKQQRDMEQMRNGG